MPLSNLERKPWSLNKNLTIKTQMLIISFVFSILIMGFLFGGAFLSSQILQASLQEASNKIFNSQTQSSQNFAWLYQHGMEELVSRTTNHISTVRRLNQFVQEKLQQGENFAMPMPKFCLTNKTDFDSYCFKNAMSCGVFGTPLNQELRQELKSIMITTSLMDVIRLEYDFNSFSPIYFTFNNSAQYYCIAVGLPFPPTFKPQKRPYYLETVEKMKYSTDPEEFYFVSPHMTVANQIRCPTTTALLDLDSNFIGLIAKDLDFNYTFINKHNQYPIIHIMSKDGTVVFADQYRHQNQPMFYLNESKYSGFNQQDYEQIMSKHYGSQFQSACKNFDFANVLCRYNSLVMENLIITTTNITGTSYILVILSQINSMKLLETEHIQLLNHQIDSIISGYILITIIAAATIIFLSQLMTIFILRQLNGMINNINKLIHKTHYNYRQKTFRQFMNNPFWKEETFKNHIDEIFKENIISSNSVTKLTQKIGNLFHSMTNSKKCEECIKQENLDCYPNVERVQLRNFKFVHKLKVYLKNKSLLARKFYQLFIREKMLK